MEENSLPPVSPQSSASGPGSQLAARRQALGWTIDQVANQLNLAPRQVQAMEEDNYAALPGIVIARGFVRAYAKLLKLDAAPLLALISEKAEPSHESLELRRALSASFTESNLPTAKRSSGRKWLVLLMLVLLLAAAAGLAWREGWLSAIRLPDGMPVPAADTQRPAAPDAGSGVPMGQAERGAAPTPAESEPPQSTVLTLPAPTTSSVPPTSSTAPSAPATTPVVPPASTAVHPSGMAPVQGAAAATAAASAMQPPAGGQPLLKGEKLSLKVREASWIEIKREDGAVIASRLMQAGSSESFDVEPGVRLVVGNAAGVEATFRGQALDLNSGAKNNVARVTLK